jgi:superfamily II DNA or RNA helicase
MVPHIDFKSVCESTTKKTVVFTSFVEALEAVDRSLSTLGMNPLTVYGKTNNELNKTIRSFENNEDLNPLVATFQSLSTAVPLVMADTMIMIDSPFRSYIREQAISRIHRLGADTQVVVYEVSLDTGDEPNISTRSSDILAWSQEQVTAIMGIESPFEMTTSIESVTISAEGYDLNEHYQLSPAPTPNVVANW